MKLITAIFCSLGLGACDLGAHDATETQVFKSTQRYIIFSPMEGVLLKDGQPLPNATIIRRLRWNGNEDGEVSEFLSDKNGNFQLPIREEELELGMMDQFVAKASLAVEHGDGIEDIWYSSKLRAEVYDETGGFLEKLVCDLAADEIAVPMGPTAILTRCHWDNMPE